MIWGWDVRSGPRPRVLVPRGPGPGLSGLNHEDSDRMIVLGDARLLESAHPPVRPTTLNEEAQPCSGAGEVLSIRRVRRSRRPPRASPCLVSGRDGDPAEWSLDHINARYGVRVRDGRIGCLSYEKLWDSTSPYGGPIVRPPPLHHPCRAWAEFNSTFARLPAGRPPLGEGGGVSEFHFSGFAGGPLLHRHSPGRASPRQPAARTPTGGERYFR